MNPERGGFRGYISSRRVRNMSFPQRIQNSIVRTYAARNGLLYKLSLTEYAMPNCFMMLDVLLAELPKLDGIILFSMFMLPSKQSVRKALYARILENQVQLHAALEEISIRRPDETARFEDTLQIAAALRSSPLRGRFRKAGQPYSPSDPFVSALRQALRSE